MEIKSINMINKKKRQPRIIINKKMKNGIE